MITKEEAVTEIEKFILDQSILHKNIGFKAFQYLQSFSEDAHEDI